VRGARDVVHSLADIPLEPIIIHLHRQYLPAPSIPNSETELFSYVQFLQYQPYDQRLKFAAALKTTSNDKIQVFKRLQGMLLPIMLRRTKKSTIDGERILNLPERFLPT